ncbi:MAG: hypothetical protein NZ843_01325, partial [Fimbriimonadales bacterium]|nr:hypothetical protein [Fimbriimonadales bacterium]
TDSLVRAFGLGKTVQATLCLGETPKPRAACVGEMPTRRLGQDCPSHALLGRDAQATRLVARASSPCTRSTDSLVRAFGLDKTVQATLRLGETPKPRAACVGETPTPRDTIYKQSLRYSIGQPTHHDTNRTCPTERSALSADADSPAGGV